ncbi:MAG: hypothetical protein Q9217_002369 [Psora testacea]
MTSTKKEEFSSKDMPSLVGSVAIVTGGAFLLIKLGCSDGIGYETSLQLALHGARVYILSRSSEKATQAISAMKQSAPDQKLDMHFLQVDLQSLASVNEAVQKFRANESKLDILINNAGIMATPYALTKDGYEAQWQTNYLSPFFLIISLLLILTSTATGKYSGGSVRIANVSSDAAFVPFAPNLDIENPNLDYLTGWTAAWKRYCHSKLALVLLTHHLHTLFINKNLPIKTYVLNPGYIATNLQAADPTLLGKIVKYTVKWGLVPGTMGREDGARTTLACVTSDDKDIVEGSGYFFGPFGKRNEKGDALVNKWQKENMEVKLWEASGRMVREKGFDI